LGGVGKVAELGFPDDQGSRVLEGESQLEAEDGKLRERGIARVEAGLVGVDVPEGHMLFPEPLLVVNYGVAVRERATLDVLAGDADVVTLGQQRRPRELLSHGPVNALTGLNHLLTSLVDLAHHSVRRHLCRQRGQRCSNLLQHVE